ncbi:TerC family protein [Hugenholtzia roseola]|uniref:TerC family protein n=1 Tax=Hugenholtzia roseola TaxID=1002 RepID=UPI000426884F|nr:TerC family protein [Hugenholtzia roseola]
MEDISYLLTSAGLMSLLVLALLEIVLGIDNVIFISIIADKLPKKDQGTARNLGLALALVVRVGLLFGITWLTGLTEPLFDIHEFFNGLGLDWKISKTSGEISGKDLILLIGGLFLIGKTTTEIHAKMELTEEEEAPKGKANALFSAIVQIVLIDIVFSFDSILTAVGIAKNVYVMIVAVVISMGVMMLFAKNISDFINAHPTLKMLALSFLIMIGFMLVIESFDVHVEKGYIYFAMAFAFVVELLNMRLRKGSQKKSRDIIPNLNNEK